MLAPVCLFLLIRKKSGRTYMTSYSMKLLDRAHHAHFCAVYCPALISVSCFKHTN